MSRVGIVGARRVRQGLGPFVARELVASGAEVPCFLGTSEASVATARAELREQGVEAAGYTDLERMLAEERLDALAVLSPAETHAQYLRAAIEASLHVLCEKPLVWPPAGGVALARAFEERGLLLAENCQWPATLGAYRELFPGVLDGGALDGGVRDFAMRLTPSSRGLAMIADSMSHPLSLLQALAPAQEVAMRDLAYSTRDAEADELVVAFTYLADGRPIDVRVDLVRGETQPREAGYSVNRHRMRRVVRMPEYSQALSDGTREVPLPDPLGIRVAGFVRDLEAATLPASGRPGGVGPGVGDRSRQVREVVQRLLLLEELREAYQDGPR